MESDDEDFVYLDEKEANEYKKRLNVESCMFCKYFYNPDGPYWTTEDRAAIPLGVTCPGECSRNAPVVFLAKDMKTYAGGELDTVTVWPMVQAYQWCGQFSRGNHRSFPEF